MNDEIRNICTSIRKLIREGEVAGARELLTKHPELIERVSGASWLGDAARVNNLEMCRMLLGIGVPQWLDHQNCNLSALTEAAVYADAKLVKWLIDQGGAIRPGERILISALNREKNEGKLEIFRLIVEAGADPNQVFQYMDDDHYFTVFDWAKAPGHEEIFDYLKTIGAKTAAELRHTPAHPLFDASEAENEKQTGHSELTRQTESPVETEKKLQMCFRVFEALGDLQEKALGALVPLGGDEVRIHVVKPEIKGKPLTLFSNGMSAKPMNVPEEWHDYRFGELYIQLPGDWDVSNTSPQQSWPIKWIRMIVDNVLNGDGHLGGVCSIVSNAPPEDSVAPDLPFTSVLCFADNKFEHRDGQLTHFYRLVPLHPEEVRWEQTHGIHDLVDKLESQGDFHVFDPSRSSSCT